MSEKSEVASSGLSSRDLLLVVLGDFWLRCDDPIPSAALVAVLAEFGVTGTSARVALSRLTHQDVLAVSKQGRRTSYQLTGKARKRAATTARRLMRFGLDWPSWDGRWTCVVFSLAEDSNRVGPALRARLRGLRMGQLYDGFWVSPHDRTEQVGRICDELGVVSATLLRARVADAAFKGRDPVDAWELSSLRDSYARFVDEGEALVARLRAGDLDAAESLTARTMMTTRWRRFANEDPLLPHELLPVGWPMIPARLAFAAVYDGLGPLAEARVRDITAPFGIAGDALPRHHKTADFD